MSERVFLPKERLGIKQILEVLSDSVFIIDVNGRVEFMNKAAEKLMSRTNLGVVGENYQVIYDAATDAADSQQVIEGILAGERMVSSKHSFLFSCQDGSTCTINETIQPLLAGAGEVEAVICTWEIVPSYKTEHRINRLAFRDGLTGLFNRAYFEQELVRFDKPSRLPLTILVGDLDGLKLTNDIFGHQAGDELLQLAAEALQKVCGSKGKLFRWGGDEFIGLLPNTSACEGAKIKNMIKSHLQGKSIGPIKLHMALGCATKENLEQDIQVLWQLADEEMYWEKSIERGKYESEMLDSITQELFSRSKAEENHAIRVSLLAGQFGAFLGLSEAKLRQLRLAGRLHDIGKVALNPELLHQPFPLMPRAQHEMRRHSLVGFRLLSFFAETVDLAEGVLAHHERWDGRGYPKGLKGEEIPRLGRILAIIETFDRVLFDPHAGSFTQAEALRLIEEGAGGKFDPELVQKFLAMVHTQGIKLEEHKKPG